jgi:hypothetical protein
MDFRVVALEMPSAPMRRTAFKRGVSGRAVGRLGTRFFFAALSDLPWVCGAALISPFIVGFRRVLIRDDVGFFPGTAWLPR